MSPRVLGHLRTAAVLAVLGLILVVGVSWGLDNVTKPFPERADPPPCLETPVSPGDVLRPAGITVSVLNASERNGLAGVTLNDLVDQGFARGQIANVPDEKVKTAQIWSPEGRTAAVRLVRGYLGGKVEIVDRSSTTAGITVVVGDQFSGVVSGRARVKATAPGTVCAPTLVAE